MNNKISNHSGFTLIELMVSMVLASLFIGGIAQVFVSTSQNFKTQRTLSYMMEDARFALDKLNSEFRRIGFLTNREMPDWARDDIYHAGIALDYAGGVYTIRNNGIAVLGGVLTMAAGEAIRGATNLGGLGSDVALIRYQLGSGAELTNNQYSPCTSGFAYIAGAGEQDRHRHIIAIVFYMEFDAGVGSNILYCKAFRENLDAGTSELLNAVPLISNVERLRVLYGETGVTPGPPDQLWTVYRSENQILPAPSGWITVKSARISLVLRSDESNVAAAAPGNYLINGKLSVAPTNAAENRLYRVFTTTAAFRNELL